MKRRPRRGVACCARARLLLVFSLSTAVFGATDQEWDRRFAVEVKPLLAAKCFACHGQNPDALLGGLDLTSPETAEKTLSAGDSSSSKVYEAVTWTNAKLRMPPKENDRLSEGQIRLIRDWIDAGAAWPNEETQARHLAEDLNGVTVTTSGGQSDDWTNRRYKSEDLWAFQPLNVVQPPAGGNPIDYFHREKLLDLGLEPAPEADRLALVRRASYDLTGLPPTAEQREKPWAELVDSLLASPRYGEQWGRHWLDVARYADTAGNSNDYERSNAWRYRDYVIRSFNSDKPYDQFVLEQLAGDELRPEDPEMLVATGFLRMGPWGSAMVPKKMARQAYLDDVVNSVGVTFLSLPLRCAKCHDHKFDPIPTRDYYRVYAAFGTTQIAERPAAFLAEENQARFEEGRQHVGALRDFATERVKGLRAKMEQADREWYAERGVEYLPLNKRSQVPDLEKPPRNYGLTSEEEGRLKVRQQDEWIWTRRLERYEPLAQSIFNGEDYIPGNGRKLRVPEKLDAEWRPESAIFAGGSVHAPTEAVTPGVLSAIGPWSRAREQAVGGGSGNRLLTRAAPVRLGDPWAVTEELDGRRLEFAKWVVDERNTLTGRSIVNRVWAYHFGRGLAANPNNFGVSGAKPTHPELLDWLTADFIENGWKLKRLHRLIMTSQLYRQSGERADMADYREKDTNNLLMGYFQPRRLTAEEIRDSMLAASGELNLEMGGVPAMPEINMEVALQPRMIQFSIAPAHQPSRTPAERNRRSIYTYKVRGQADPFLEVFNQPNPNASCERRDSAAVSPQALTLMNSEMATARSIAFAIRLEREAESIGERVDRAFRLTLAREPDSAERDALVAYYERMLAHHRSRDPQPTAYPTRVTRSLVEEFTGAPFQYEELLNRFEDYVPDSKAWEVSAETRALADVCLLMFNSNEFAYVY